MFGTTYSSLQSSDTLNYQPIWSLIELASLYTVPRSAVNGLSRLINLNEQARPIWFENFRIGQSLSNQIESDRRFEFESNLEASQVPTENTLFRLGNGSLSATIVVLVVGVVVSTKSFFQFTTDRRQTSYTNCWQCSPESHRVGFSS